MHLPGRNQCDGGIGLAHRGQQVGEIIPRQLGGLARGVQRRREVQAAVAVEVIVIKREGPWRVDEEAREGIVRVGPGRGDHSIDGSRIRRERAGHRVAGIRRLQGHHVPAVVWQRSRPGDEVAARHGGRHPPQAHARSRARSVGEAVDIREARASAELEAPRVAVALRRLIRSRQTWKHFAI